MKNFNLAEWSLEHTHLVVFLICLLAALGMYSYENLGRMEDPDYTVREMVVVTRWPGATARQVEEQVTDKLEKKLQGLEGLSYVQSYSLPEQSIIYVDLKDAVMKKDIARLWADARNLILEEQSSLPQGTATPVVNDHFDDVYGMIYALTASDGYSYEDMRQKAEKIRQRRCMCRRRRRSSCWGCRPRPSISMPGSTSWPSWASRRQTSSARCSPTTRSRGAGSS